MQGSSSQSVGYRQRVCDNPPLCINCNVVATRLTSQSSRNPGRDFYKCFNCDSFLSWADEAEESYTAFTDLTKKWLAEARGEVEKDQAVAMYMVEQEEVFTEWMIEQDSKFEYLNLSMMHCPKYVQWLTEDVQGGTFESIASQSAVAISWMCSQL